jgi:single-strand DNA-binding protein
MRGIETAFWGVIGKDPELKQSKGGTPYLNMGIAVTIGEGDDGKTATQWVRVAVFGETAEKIAARCKKGDRVYAEGQLTLSPWNTADGECRTGLNCAAWRCEKVSNIGKAREKKPGSYQDNGEPGRAGMVSASYRAGPAPRQRSGSADGDDFNDQLGF